MVFFIKYEYWPNYLKELKAAGIKTYMISGIFRKKQAFFKWYGGFYRNALTAFTYFFVQNESSKILIHKLGFSNVQVSEIPDLIAWLLYWIGIIRWISLRNSRTITFYIVIGSSWPKDETLLVWCINQCNYKIKFIIAPHNIKAERDSELKNSITKNTVLFSEKKEKLSRLLVLKSNT